MLRVRSKTIRDYVNETINYKLKKTRFIKNRLEPSSPNCNEPELYTNTAIALPAYLHQINKTRLTDWQSPTIKNGVRTVPINFEFQLHCVCLFSVAAAAERIVPGFVI